jgi:predicted permease
MALGFLLGKTKALRGNFKKGLTDFVVQVNLPALIFVSLVSTSGEDVLGQGLVMLLVALGAYAFYFALSFGVSTLVKFPPKDQGTYRFAMVFANVGFMGYPMVQSLLGEESLFLASIFNIPFQLLVFSLGVILLTVGQPRAADPADDEGGLQEKKPKKNLGSLLLSPGILATFLGVVVFAFSTATGWQVPAEPLAFIEVLGDMSTPLSMILIGLILSEIRWGGALANPYLWFLSGLRLLLIPLGLWALLLLVGVKGNYMRIAVTIASMPVAANAPILATAYDGNGALAGEMVLVSTVLGFLTIPVIQMLF